MNRNQIIPFTNRISLAGHGCTLTIRKKRMLYMSRFQHSVARIPNSQFPKMACKFTSHEWPEVMFKANELFSKSTVDKVNKITLPHPKIYSFMSHLNKSGVTEKSTLHSNITINLPQKVQRENGSWSMEKVLVSDTKMILLEFSAYQKTLIINDADTSLDF